MAAAGVAGAFATGRLTAPSEGSDGSHLAASYPFRGEHQAGIVTPAQDRLHFVALDVITEDRAELIDLLRRWTDAAERMVAGGSAGPVGPVAGPSGAPPDDTGEAIGLEASRLTITFGFGPTLFRDEKGGRDRFGLAQRQPDALQPLPRFSADVLEPRRTGGDLCIQACADDPQVAVHAVRNLVRMGFGTTSVRWSQLGFGRTSTTSVDQSTPRNLFGFKDGTANVKAEETSALSTHVWISEEDSAGEWLAGGSYLVARRINMTIETWDRQTLQTQEEIIGRTKDTGAPLSGGEEFSEPDLGMAGSAGPLIPVDSHVRVVHPSEFAGARMLRRGYNFVDGSNDIGGLDAGLFFIAYVRDPNTQFIPIQRAMAKNDAMMEYLRFTGQALFVVPPGTADGEYVGQTLFG